jgi:uncharacterized protein (DUF1778 family)
MKTYTDEQKEIRLSPEKFKEFTEALDKPTEPSPALHRLLTEPSVIELAQRVVEV